MCLFPRLVSEKEIWGCSYSTRPSSLLTQFTNSPSSNRCFRHWGLSVTHYSLLPWTSLTAAPSSTHQVHFLNEATNHMYPPSIMGYTSSGDSPPNKVRDSIIPTSAPDSLPSISRGSPRLGAATTQICRHLQYYSIARISHVSTIGPYRPPRPSFIPPPRFPLLCTAGCLISEGRKMGRPSAVEIRYETLGAKT